MERNTQPRVSRLILVPGMTLLLFAVQTALMRATLQYASSIGQTLALSALFALVYGGTMAAYARLERPSAGTLAFVGAFAALTMLARVSMLDYVAADYTYFLSGWTQMFREGGFSMLAKNVGDYNLLYQYALLLIAKTPLHDLYLIKLLTMVFDYLLALAMMRAARRFGGERAALPVLLIVMALPTVLLDGACWGQCDSVYVFFIVMSLYLLETDRPGWSAASLAIAFAFKLQTIFFFPVVLLGLIHKKYKPRHAGVFFASYLVTMLPALVAGRPFFDALSVYANQSMNQYYDRLTYNAPNLYLFFPMLEASNSQEFTWLRYVPGIDAKGTNAYLDAALLPDLQHAVLYACILLTVLVVGYWLIHYREVTPDMTLAFALFFAIFLPYVMPKIHERYFYLADMLSILYACSRRDRRFMPLLVVGASLMSYVPYLMRQRPIDERWLALAMGLALVIVARDLLWRMRANRAALAKGGEDAC
ncbi:MAG: glycosyltransferase 87 family protein [Candidatus Ventricola sp.]